MSVFVVSEDRRQQDIQPFMEKREALQEEREDETKEG
jgi:hypothetical protein